MANNMNEVVIFGAASGLGLAMVNYFMSNGVSVIGVARNVEKINFRHCAIKRINVMQLIKRKF